MRDVRVPFTVRWNRDAHSATVDLQGTTVQLKEGGWSEWVRLEFRVNLLVRLRGMVQLHLRRATGDLQLYVSPVNWPPDAPVVPISAPASFAGELYEGLGIYRTLGLGGGHVAAQRGPARRAGVHGRTCSAPSTTARVSSCARSTRSSSISSSA